MSKSLLWYQHQDPKQDDVMFLNGKMLTKQCDIQENFSIISFVANKAIEKPTPWCGRINNLFFLKGFLNSNDNLGRMMSFIYITDNKDYRASCITELRAAGLAMSKETENCLSEKYIRYRCKKYLTYIIYIAGILTILTCLCTLFTCSRI